MRTWHRCPSRVPFIHGGHRRGWGGRCRRHAMDAVGLGCVCAGDAQQLRLLSPATSTTAGAAAAAAIVTASPVTANAAAAEDVPTPGRVYGAGAGSDAHWRAPRGTDTLVSKLLGPPAAATERPVAAEAPMSTGIVTRVALLPGRAVWIVSAAAAMAGECV